MSRIAEGLGSRALRCTERSSSGQRRRHDDMIGEDEVAFRSELEPHDFWGRSGLRTNQPLRTTRSRCSNSADGLRVALPDGIAAARRCMKQRLRETWNEHKASTVAIGTVPSPRSGEARGHDVPERCDRARAIACTQSSAVLNLARRACAADDATAQVFPSSGVVADLRAILLQHEMPIASVRRPALVQFAHDEGKRFPTAGSHMTSSSVPMSRAVEGLGAQ